MLSSLLQIEDDLKIALGTPEMYGEFATHFANALRGIKIEASTFPLMETSNDDSGQPCKRSYPSDAKIKMILTYQGLGGLTSSLLVDAYS